MWFRVLRAFVDARLRLNLECCGSVEGLNG